MLFVVVFLEVNDMKLSIFNALERYAFILLGFWIAYKMGVEYPIYFSSTVALVGALVGLFVIALMPLTFDKSGKGRE